MPKVKRAAQTDFQISPWQSAHRPGSSNPTAEHDADVIYCDLINSRALGKAEVTAAPTESQADTSSSPQAGSRLTHSADTTSQQLEQGDALVADSAIRNNNLALAETVPRPAAAAAAEDRDDDGFGLFDDPSAQPSRLPACSGLCQVALLPSGQLSGHFIHSVSRVCYGVVGEQIAGPSGDCLEDDETLVMRLKLINFQNGQEVEAGVVKTGGDLACIRPAEAGQLVRAFGVDLVQAEQELVVQVQYDASRLLHDDAADEHLRRFNPALRGSGAVVNVGQMTLTALPEGFL